MPTSTAADLENLKQINRSASKAKHGFSQFITAAKAVDA
jgi:hypothetical protein